MDIRATTRVSPYNKTEIENMSNSELQTSTLSEVEGHLEQANKQGLPKGWKKCNLGYVLSSNLNSIGKNYPYQKIEYLDTGSITNNKIESFQSFDIKDAPSRAKRLVKHQNIIYSTVRPIQRHFGFIENPQENLVVSTGFSVLDIDKNLASPKFIYYFLSSNEVVEELDAIAEGATSAYPSLKPSDIESLEINLPPLAEQKAIAEVLSSLDDKIDLLHQQNQTLEDMAQTLFREWFIEKADEGWEDGKLPDEFDFLMGVSPKGNTFNEEKIGTPMFQGNADFSFRFPKNRIYTTDPKRFADRYDTLISVRAPVGAQNMAEEKCCIGRGLASFKYRNNKDFYTYTYYKLMSLMEEIKAFNNTGTVFGSISKTDFQNIDVVIPPKDVVENFESLVKPLNDKIIENEEQIRMLEQTRDTLLPKLMSGQVRV